jgi:uncharacterized protein (TIGR02186 family)
MSRALPLLVLLCLLHGMSGARAAEPLIADLTSHLVAITTGFTGTNVVLFGATDGGGDVIVVVRGPDHDEVVRRKSKVAGIWMNTKQVTFTGVPSFYSVYSSRPLDEIMPPAMQALHQVGFGNLRLGIVEKNRSAEELADFRTALARVRQREGLFGETVGRVAFLGDRLFHATIGFPANVPTGTYRVEIFLVRDRGVISGQTTPLVVSQVGIDAEVNEFANRRALLYGVLAVLGAAMAGWLASLPFRNA